MEDDYNQTNFMTGLYDRDYSGMSNDWRSRATVVELEGMIEDDIAKRRLEEKKFKMYKGQVKKWQILDDEVFDRDQIEKVQASAQAPLPEELEMYRDNTKEWFFGNVNNENARAWRDEALPTDSADFDPDFLKLDREKRQKYFVERYEDVKQLE